MKVLYGWARSDTRENGINGPLLRAYNCDLAPNWWNNPDHKDMIRPDGDVFILSANVKEIRQLLVPRIRNKKHLEDCVGPFLESNLLPGLPFLVSRDLQYVQRLQKLPWRTVRNTTVTIRPFVDLNLTINYLEALHQIAIPNYTQEHRMHSDWFTPPAGHQAAGFVNPPKTYHGKP